MDSEVADRYRTLPERNKLFKNRVDELDKINKYFFENEFRFIIIYGTAGVGKTSLVLEYCYQNLDSLLAKFKYILWISAKKMELGLFWNFLQIPHIRRSANPNRCPDYLPTLFAQILRETKHPDYEAIEHLEEYEMRSNVLSWLKYQPTLLVIDDLDSWDDWGKLLVFIKKIPPESCVIITSRRKLDNVDIPGSAPLELRPISRAKTRELINALCTEYNIHQLGKDEMEQILDYSNGYPLFVQLMIAYISKSSYYIGKKIPVVTALREVTRNNEFVDFLYDDLFNKVAPESKQLLAAIVANLNLKGKAPTRLNLTNVTHLNLDQLEYYLEPLKNAFLIDVRGKRKTIDIHELTINYMNQRQTNLVQEFERKITGTIEEYLDSGVEESE